MQNLNGPLAACLALVRADAELRRRFDRALSNHGLSLSDLTLMLELRKADGVGVRRLDLAERVGLTASGVTRLLAPLERLGFVARQPNPRDARLALATLTDEGRELCDHAWATAEELAAELIESRLTSTETATLQKLLAKLSA